MKILISSHAFYPSIGGLESVSAMLAQEFVEQGHEVQLVTQTSAAKDELLNPAFPFHVVRQPSLVKLLALVNWCDLFWHNNISLQTFLPLLPIRKPWIVTHQTWIARKDGSLSWQGQSKMWLTRFATNISISEAIATHLPVSSKVIGNPYDRDYFFTMPEISRNKDLVFLGRLVFEKGVDLLLEALRSLKQIGLTPELTIIGTGSELNKLQKLAIDLRINDQVSFVGTKTGLELTQLLNAHRIMVMPSRWQEPFGVVALEGIACGCAIVASDGGGLKDAVGNCGLTFPNGDLATLTQKLAELLANRDRLAIYQVGAKQHLARHTKQAVAESYLQVFEDARR
jgi:glycogen synthase